LERKVTDSSTIKAHYIILAYLLRQLVTERFKSMAKDRVLFKFISSRVDPALLIDHAIHAEKEALDLAEMSLLKLVDSDKMASEVHKSAFSIQSTLQGIFGDEVSKEFASNSIVEIREKWLHVRIDFYRKWLSFSERCDSPIDLVHRTFSREKKFEDALSYVHKVDKMLADETVHLTNSLHAFLMKKQLDYELEHSKNLWAELQKDAFKEQAALT
jgi:hypothetical protein